MINKPLDWIEFPILQNLDNQQLMLLNEKSNRKKFIPGDIIIKEGHIGRNIYFLAQGEVSIKKDNLTISKKTAGDYFGFMSIVDSTKRSADVIADTEVITYTIDKDDLNELDNANIQLSLLSYHIRHQQSTVRSMNDSVVSEMKEKLATAQTSLFASRFFAVIILGLVSYQFLLGTFIEFTELSHDRELMRVMNPMLMIVIGAAALLKAYKSPYSLSEYGLNLNNWKKNLTEAILWSVAFITVLVITKWLTITYTDFIDRKILIDTNDIDSFDSTSQVIFFYILYALLSPVQEFIARGVIQGSLINFLNGKHKATIAIVLSNLMFSGFHIHLDMRFAILTLIPGIFWGFMYNRQKSLLGVSISHILIGLFVFMFMGLV